MIKFFTARWCTVCTSFKENLQEGDMDNVEVIDAEQEPDLLIEYNIKSVPTFVKVVDGEEIDRKNGSLTRTDFLSWANE